KLRAPDLPTPANTLCYLDIWIESRPICASFADVTLCLLVGPKAADGVKWKEVRGRSAAMTLLLASVTGPEEAEIAVRHGADIVDLKDPARGAFGAVAPRIVAATVAAVAGRRPVSAVAGELAMEPDAIVGAASALADAGVDYVKVALFPEPGRAACIRALASLARRVK